MQRIVHDFDPFLFRIYGDFGIRWYSLPYILGFVLAYLWLQRSAEKGEIRGLRPEQLDTFLGYTFFGVLFGARFFHVFVFEYSNYGFDPLRWIAVWRGGLSFHGGLLGAVAGMVIFARRYRIAVYALTDRVAVPVAIALGFGRIGNFINGEMYGTPWDGPFCIDYSQNPHLPHAPEGCRHPTQLYQVAKNWGIATTLWLVATRIRPRPGVITWLFIGLYGLIRFFLMFIRDEERVIAGLTLSQVFSGLMALLAAAMLVRVLTRPPAPDPAPTTAGQGTRQARRRRK
jgi:phosphatidylglycerol---prolipoprotein diacylglyceryl transferase